jgi:hypothetical protein
MSFSYAVPVEQQGSFLAFLYAIRFIPEVRDYFKGSGRDQADEVMAAYKLTDEEREAVWELHPQSYPNLSHGERAERWASLAALLLPEFYDWTYNHEPPFWW